MLRYCKKCVMPSTKPDLSFDDDGVCSACRAFATRGSIDWAVRRTELDTVLDRYRSKDGARWDCIVPVSGGKDSTYQVMKVLELGLNPLCVTATTCDFSALGRRNLDNLRRLGVDHYQVSPKPTIRKKLNRLGLLRVGDISWPEHIGIFTVPVRAAVEANVPLIVWGENSQNEYGGPATAQDRSVLDRRWLEEFGGLLGMRLTDLIGVEGIEQRDLIPYTYPDDAELLRVGVTGVFLGYYFPWDGYSNALLVQGSGFETYPLAVEGALANYENLDNHQTGIHDYFKFLKYGFGRATDHACLHLRRGRISRDDALSITQRLDGKFPWTCLGKPIDDILRPLDLSVDEFIKICDRFTNKAIFRKDARGGLLKDRFGNLTKINYDNA